MQKKLEPITDKLTGEFSEIVFVRFNVAEDSEISSRYSVSAVQIPVFFRNSGTISGKDSEEKLSF